MTNDEMLHLTLADVERLYTADSITAEQVDWWLELFNNTPGRMLRFKRQGECISQMYED